MSKQAQNKNQIMPTMEIEVILKKIETVSSEEIDHWVDKYEEVIDTLPDDEADKYEQLYDSILLKRMTNIWAVIADTEHLMKKPKKKVSPKSKGFIYTMYLWIMKWRRQSAHYPSMKC